MFITALFSIEIQDKLCLLAASAKVPEGSDLNNIDEVVQNLCEKMALHAIQKLPAEHPFKQIIGDGSIGFSCGIFEWALTPDAPAGTGNSAGKSFSRILHMDNVAQLAKEFSEYISKEVGTNMTDGMRLI